MKNKRKQQSSTGINHSDLTRENVSRNSYGNNYKKAVKMAEEVDRASKIDHKKLTERFDYRGTKS